MNRLVSLAVLLLAAPASAQTQTEMTISAGAAYAKADAAMTAQWKVTFARMKARDAADISRGGGFGYAAALFESQRAWLKFRDAQCVIEGGEVAGGSMQPMVIAACKADLTKQRTTQLHELEWRN